MCLVVVKNSMIELSEIRKQNTALYVFENPGYAKINAVAVTYEILSVFPHSKFFKSTFM